MVHKISYYSLESILTFSYTFSSLPQITTPLFIDPSYFSTLASFTAQEKPGTQWHTTPQKDQV